MQIPRDDVEDVKELTEDISEYIFNKINGLDERMVKNIVTSVTSTLIINIFDHPIKAFEFIEKLCSIIESMSEIREEEK